MLNAYKVLGLARDASESDIRKRYLELVRDFPPERAPERFARIRAAYDEIRDPIARLEKSVLDLHNKDSFTELMNDVRTHLHRGPFSLETLSRLANL